MLKNYLEIREWLESFIPLVYGKEELGLARIENLLKKLGNPEKKFKSILVGGTSGKGTTAYMIARILQSCNFKCQISNVKCQMSDKLIPMGRFVGLANEIKAVVDDIIANQPGKTPSYFEIL